MRYREILTVTTHHDEPLGDFLFSGALVATLCAQQNSSPGGLVLEQLVSARDNEESFDNWLCRQVAEILSAQVQLDDWRDNVRTQQHLEGVVLSIEDRAWLLERYRHHPEVLAVWEAAVKRQEQALAA